MTRWRFINLLVFCFLAGIGPVTALEAGDRKHYELTLDQALALASTRAPAARAAPARIDEARGRLVGASVPLLENPTIEVGAGPRFGRDGSRADVEVGVGQVFALGPRRQARIDAATAGVEEAASTAEDRLRRALHSVATAFLRARHGEERLLIATESERLAAGFHRIALRRYEVGDVGGLDVSLAALALARIRTEVRIVEAARDRALGDLRVLLGLEPDATVAVRGDLLDRTRFSLETLLEGALDRPDLRALSASIRGADAKARLGKARAWPELGLHIGYAREEADDIVRTAVTLELPLFDHGQGLESASRARGKALRIEQDAAERTAHAEIRETWDIFERSLRAVEGFESDGLPALERVDSIARQSYEAGAMPLSELLTIRRELIEARFAYADLLLDTALAGVELEAAAGVLQ